MVQQCNTIQPTGYGVGLMVNDRILAESGLSLLAIVHKLGLQL
jgi:hypothetical protein